jgi:hypothetical protein
MTMRKFVAYLTAVIFMGMSLAVIAKPGNGGGHMGGSSDSHMSDKGTANTNGPDAADRDHGQERAEDRMNQHGMDHEKSGEAAGSDHHHANKGKHHDHH